MNSELILNELERDALQATMFIAFGSAGYTVITLWIAICPIMIPI